MFSVELKMKIEIKCLIFVYVYLRYSVVFNNEIKYLYELRDKWTELPIYFFLRLI